MRLPKAIAASPCDSPARQSKAFALDEKSASLADELGFDAVRLRLIAFEYIPDGQWRQQSCATAFRGSAPNAVGPQSANSSRRLNEIF
jgi:hypothetical protein